MTLLVENKHDKYDILYQARSVVCVMWLMLDTPSYIKLSKCVTDVQQSAMENEIGDTENIPGILKSVVCRLTTMYYQLLELFNVD